VFREFLIKQSGLKNLPENLILIGVKAHYRRNHKIDHKKPDSLLITLITPDNTSNTKFRTILFSDKKVAERKTVRIFFRVQNFKRPKYLQCSIQFLSSSKAVNFLYEKNSS